MRVHFTDISVKKFKPGSYWDDSTPGFGVRVGKHAKTWTVMRGASRERITIGRYTYQYADGNPLLNSDPMGLAPVPPGMPRPPFKIPGGPWTWFPDARNSRGGVFKGPLPPGGGDRTQCTFSPPSAESPNGYWKGYTPAGNGKPAITQRYNLNGDPISVRDAKPGPVPSSPIPPPILRILGPVGTFIGMMTHSGPAY